MTWQACVAGLCASLVLVGCRGSGDGADERPLPLVVMIELDGAGLDLVNALRARGRLPNFQALMARGTSGPLQSWPSHRVMRPSDRRSLASPILWTSIATGKIPEKHGVRDFVLPVPGTASAWIGSEEDPSRAEILLPELPGGSPLTLQLKLHTFPPLGTQPVEVVWNGERLATLDVPADWKTFDVALPPRSLRSGENRLTLELGAQARPSEHGDSSDRRRLAAELAYVVVRDPAGRVLASLDPAVARERFGRGFYPARGRLTEVQSVHWRAKPVWSLLGDAGVPVGVIGHWGTWPARPVNGFLVSSRMGVREKREGSDRLTWPEELTEELLPLAPLVGDLEPTFEKLHLTGCSPRLIDRQSVLKKILIQDEYYVRIAKELFAGRNSGLYTVYLRAIDVAGHVTLQWRNGAPVPSDCPEDVRSVMNAVYDQIDAWIGEIIAAVPEDAVVIVVSDHGMQARQGVGHHAPFGLMIAAGGPIREGRAVNGSTVLDLAPTLMYLFGQPVPLDMDGKVLASIFRDDFLARHSLRYADVDTSITPDFGITLDTEASEEALEELRALGYIE